jgi:hypothetical protein
MARFRRIQSKISIVVLTLLITNSVKAQEAELSFDIEELPNRLLPDYIPCTYKGERYACFNSEQMVALNMLELKARYWHTQWDNYAHWVSTGQAELENAQEQLDVQRDMARLDADRVNAMTDELIGEIELKNKWRSKAENPPKWPLWLGGSFAVLGFGMFLRSILR